MPDKVENEQEKKFRFFGDVDRLQSGKVKSEYPSWYSQSHIEELEESIRHKEYQLDNDLIMGSEKGITKERLKKEKERLNAIEESRPRFSEQEISDIVKIVGNGKKFGSLGEKICSAMPTRSEMEKGLADAHEVERRWNLPCLMLTADEIPFVRGCDVTVSNDGKVTQLGAEKAWKIGRKLIGESSNCEVMRKG